MITVNEFTPSVELLGTDTIASADEKIRTVMDEAGDFLEEETQNAVTQMEEKVDDKLVELAHNPGTTYTPAQIDSKMGFFINSRTIGNLIVTSGTNQAIVTPAVFTSIKVEDNAILKLI